MGEIEKKVCSLNARVTDKADDDGHNNADDLVRRFNHLAMRYNDTGKIETD